ncbi:FadR/GntR family transcriptional regulator [Pseudalkalibacillus caeni]|uniref:FadR family transcriptional regulator n=1 Tax=Exobacillus caeni TaxID=2574798 RepID=A0A5R9FE26_9BACL|nr:GntR family transcriptional regulator [Pseudalkalibacillus caeni]TLS39133.1 FadR family transcriptional regulator [Pseudalkalibacillus caeni]
MLSSQQDKVYQAILHQIKAIIYNDGLQTGDKLPSERELSERLKVGRSSVREALRSLELLGLIETRRGEGTFISEAKDHRLVEILASFILKDTKSKHDLLETKMMIEADIIRLAIHRITKEDIKALSSVVKASDSSFLKTEEDYKFFRIIVESTENYLLYRLWLELAEFYLSVWKPNMSRHASHYEKIIESLLHKDEHGTIDALQSLYKKISS